MNTRSLLYITAAGKIALSSALSPANAATTTLISSSTSATTGDWSSLNASISADGRFIAFESSATDIVNNDHNHLKDIFIRDTLENTTQLISRNSSGTQANDISHSPAISADGRYVTYVSKASNLSSDDQAYSDDIFVYDRITRITSRVSKENSSAQGKFESGSINPTISADGHYISYESSNTNLVADDNNAANDIFVYDRLTAATTRISVDSSGNQASDSSHFPSISADGRYITFSSSAFDLVSNDHNASDDIFVYDQATGQQSLVSINAAGEQADNHSILPSISADGRYIAFNSTASNLVDNDTNDASDVFVYNRKLATQQRVSLNDAFQQANNDSFGASISANGRYVTFFSSASNLTSDDHNIDKDIFAYDTQNKQQTLISINSSSEQADDKNDWPTISATGQYIAFTSSASNLIENDLNNSNDIFVHSFLAQPGTIKNYSHSFEASSWPDQWFSYGWNLDHTESFHGKAALCSNPANNNGTVSTESSINAMRSGELSFAMKIDSEKDHDFFRFYIDNELQGEYSGLIEWTNNYYPLSQGEHKLRFEYTKNSTTAVGADTVCIDQVLFSTGTVNPIELVHQYTASFESSLWASSWRNFGWERESDTASKGSYSLASTPTLDNKTSLAEVHVHNQTDGEFSFDMKMQSEQGHDFFKFYIDGTLQAEHSGDKPWNKYYYTLTKGEHRLRFEYTKDENNSVGADTVWIDQLQFNSYDFELIHATDSYINNFESEKWAENWLNHSWVLESDANAEQSLKAEPIEHSQTSATNLFINLKHQGQFSFSMKIDSEAEHDFFRFYIDDILQDQHSGLIDWEHYSYSLAAGEHRLRFEYTKNETVSHGADTVWIDNIQFNNEHTATQLQEELIQRFYLNIRNETVDAASLSRWVDQLSHSSVTQILTKFLDTKNLINTATNNAEFITILYASLLNRTPNSDEIGYWISRLELNLLRPFLIQSLIQSEEFKDIAEAMKLSAYTPDELNKFRISYFIQHTYSNILGRQPRLEELKIWATHIINTPFSSSDITVELFSSDEFTAKQYDNARFVEIVYQSISDTTTDAAEKNLKTHQLTSGLLTRNNLIQELIRSPEYNALVTHYNLQSSIEYIQKKLQQQFINNFYRTILGREADASGFTFWLEIMPKTSVTETALGFYNSRGILSSSEDNIGFIKMLFRSLLWREANPEELAYWQSQLDNGFLRPLAVHAIVQSSEFKTLTDNAGLKNYTENEQQTFKVSALLRRFYVSILLREPDLAGLNSHISGLLSYENSHTYVTNFVTMLFNSPEFTQQNYTALTFLNISYQSLLQRAPDIGGQNFWLYQLTEENLPREELIRSFVKSQEFESLLNTRLN
ncbi:MAG: DUF4214 domain-containing protein [Methyloprofundus sp.]|nr:DUF4214 domain-containing protein [Methyloprofundus sp.]